MEERLIGAFCELEVQKQGFSQDLGNNLIKGILVFL